MSSLLLIVGSVLAVLGASVVWTVAIGSVLERLRRRHQQRRARHT